MSQLRSYLSLALLGCCLTDFASGQESLDEIIKDRSIDWSRSDHRDAASRRMRTAENRRRNNARARAMTLGIETRRVFPDGRVQEIFDFEGDRPRYLTTFNASAAISTGANLLATAPYSLNGSGVLVGVWDGGSARSTHQEFGGRVTVMDGSAAIDHATHVSGTIAASGVVASARGMSPATTVRSYDWTSDSSEMVAAAATGPNQPTKIYLSNHSYGYITGWNQVNGGSPYRKWEWYGGATSLTDPSFGCYQSYVSQIDADAYNAPYYLIFRSAGNDRGESPATGDSIALAPNSVTVASYNAAVHPGGDSLYRGGYDTISFHALAKNVITVGSVGDAATNGVRDVSKAAMDTFSSWGPTDDGRIKPDVVANGYKLYSSLSTSDTAYGSYSGTSMATPNACGSSALLIQQYSSLFPSQAMRSSTLKGLLIHTADDRGNPGPDYQYGWGLVNVKSAADLLADHAAAPLKRRVNENFLSTATPSRAHAFVWDGVTPITASLCWTDPAGAAIGTADTRTANLVHNLNVKIIAPNGTEFFPFVMPFVGTWTQASMNAVATTGVNNTDNVEQVKIAMPPQAGVYQAVVSYSGTLTATQYYSLLLNGAANVPAPATISSISPSGGLRGSQTTVSIEGVNFSNTTTVTLHRSGYPDIPATGVNATSETTLTCAFDLTQAASGTWDVVVAKPGFAAFTLSAGFSVTRSFLSENFDGTVTGWSSVAARGTNAWAISTTRSQTPTKSYFAAGPNNVTTHLRSPAIAIPADASNLQLSFWHWYNFQSSSDGGLLELSTDSGTTWLSVADTASGAAFVTGAYNGTISTSTNDLYLKSVWTGNSAQFINTVINLTDTSKFNGKTLLLRWILGTNSKIASTGWNIDSVSLTGVIPENQSPIFTTAATSGSSETITENSTLFEIRRATASPLTTLATDDGGEPLLNYTWSAQGPAAVVFSQNASNAAKSTTATFTQAGDYPITVTAADAGGLTASSTVHLRVLNVPVSLALSPTDVTLIQGASQAYAASATYLFGNTEEVPPGDIAWSVDGGGNISTSGVFTPTMAGGPFTVTGSYQSVTANATVHVLAANSLAAWRIQHFSPAEITAGLAAIDADPDTDGIKNLAEYALGIDPRRTSSLPLTIPSDSECAIICTRPTGLPNVEWQPKWSENLTDWSPATLEIITPGDPETVKISPPLPADTLSRGFLNLGFSEK